MDQVRLAIDAALADAEREHQVRILLAVESGSRAWGFASTDSDWDVRFIYVHPPQWYLRVDAQRDVIERMLPMDIDLSGWELRKALALFRKSNTPLLEWLRSPLVYKEAFSTTQRLRDLDKTVFDPVSVTYHYLSMAKGNWRQYLQGDRIKRKKYLYVLRPLLACAWVERRRTMVPMEFDLLLTDEALPIAVRTEIDALLLAKRSGGELDAGPPLPAIHAWVEERLNHHAAHPPHFDPHERPGTATLDALFLDTLHEVWGTTY
jgi:uncharacterized protein